MQKSLFRRPLGYHRKNAGALKMDIYIDDKDCDIEEHILTVFKNKGILSLPDQKKLKFECINRKKKQSKYGNLTIKFGLKFIFQTIISTILLKHWIP